MRGFDLRDREAPQALTRRPSAEPEGGLVCFACGLTITSLRERFTAGGAHEHTFTNPGGYVYRIGCFRRAPGCVQAGQPTLEFTWFPGHAWRYALCAGCRAHLGWAFLAGEFEFYGLILDRLVGGV